MATRLFRPPKDLSSFLGRKWLEAITLQNQSLNSVLNLTFLLLSPNTNLPNSRTFGVTSNLSIADTGGGGTFTLDLSETSVTSGTYNTVTVDAKGRVTSGLNQDYAELDTANVFLEDQTVPDEVYGVSWNNNLSVPTKNAIYDKVETILSSGVNDADVRRLIHLGY